MARQTVLGIFREKSHSPQREFDDAEILRLTGEGLSSYLGSKVLLLEPQEFLNCSLDINPRMIFYMCEEEPLLKRIRALHHTTGCILVNPINGVENTFRYKMLPLLKESNFFPRSEMISTQDQPSLIRPPCWLKRGDFHAIEREDVVFVASPQDLRDALRGFSSRDIQQVVVQEHIPGDIVKFYCIRDLLLRKDYWFKWFYHKEQDLHGYEFSQAELLDICRRAGDLLGLEVYGGDAIVDQHGAIHIIDINAWPSFALFRDEAAQAISQLLVKKLDKEVEQVTYSMSDGELGASTSLS